MDTMTHQVRRRRRPAKSCTECRRRKVRCDLQSPCGPCAATRAECVYRALHEGRRGDDIDRVREFNSTVNISAARSRTDSTALVRSEGSPTTLESPRRPKPGHQTGVHAHSEHERLKQLEPVPDRSSKSLVAIDPPAFGKDSLSEISPAKTRVHLKKTRVLRWSDRMGNDLYSLMFNCYKQACGEGEPYSTDPQTKAVVSDMGRLLQECKSLSQLLKLDRPSRNPLHFNFNFTPPSIESSNKFIDTYFQLFESSHRIVHKPSFLKESQAFLRSQEEAPLATRLKVLLVIAIGSSLHSPPESSEVSVSRIQQWVYAASTWLAGPIEKDRLTISALQVQCLAILARQVSSIGGDLAWISASSLMHRGMQMGLHRDPRHFRGMSILDAEVRRRLWATILELVVQTSLDTAMPPRISFDDFDTEPPSNNNDDDLSEKGGSLAPKERGTFTDTTMQLLLLDSFPVRLRAVQLLNNLRQELVYAELLSLSSQIFDACSKSKLALSKHGVSQFHQNLLDYLQLRVLLPLHCTFTNQAHENKIFYYSLKVSLDTATAIVSPEPDEHYQRLMSVGGGVFREGLRYAAATLTLEFLFQSEQKRTGAASKSDRAQLDFLRSTMESMVSQAIERIRGGETNIKNHMFLKMAFAQADALEQDEQQKLEVAQAAKDSLDFCLDLMQTRLTSAPGSLSGTTMGASPLCGDHLFAHPMDFDFFMEHPLELQNSMDFDTFDQENIGIIHNQDLLAD